MSNNFAEASGGESPHSGGLLISGSADFEQQGEAARTVLDGAVARYTADGLDKDMFERGKSIVREVYDSNLTAYLYGQNGLVEAGTSAGHVAGTFDNTRDKVRPFSRLTGTALVFHKIFTGSRGEAIDAAEEVYNKHQWVHGHLRRDAHPYPAGTPYSAYDPAMMKWTAARIGKGLLVIHEVLEGPLSGDKRDEFCKDFSRFSEMFGLPREESPQTYQELQAYLDEVQNSGELRLTNTARDTGEQILLNLPLPTGGWLFRHVVMSPILRHSLSEPTREMYGIRYNKFDKYRTKLAVLAARAISALVPDDVRTKGIVPAFESVAKTEEKHISRGEPHMLVPTNPYV